MNTKLAFLIAAASVAVLSGCSTAGEPVEVPPMRDSASASVSVPEKEKPAAPATVTPPVETRKEIVVTPDKAVAVPAPVAPVAKPAPSDSEKRMGDMADEAIRQLGAVKAENDALKAKLAAAEGATAKVGVEAAKAAQATEAVKKAEVKAGEAEAKATAASVELAAAGSRIKVAEAAKADAEARLQKVVEAAQAKSGRLFAAPGAVKMDAHTQKVAFRVACMPLSLSPVALAKDGQSVVVDDAAKLAESASLASSRFGFVVPRTGGSVSASNGSVVSVAGEADAVVGCSVAVEVSGIADAACDGVLTVSVCEQTGTTKTADAELPILTTRAYRVRVPGLAYGKAVAVRLSARDGVVVVQAAPTK